MQEEKKSTSLEGVIFFILGMLIFLISLRLFSYPDIEYVVICLILSSIGGIYGAFKMATDDLKYAVGTMFFALAITINAVTIYLHFIVPYIHNNLIIGHHISTNSTIQVSLFNLISEIKHSLNLTSREAFHLIEIANSTAKCGNTKCLLLHIYSLVKKLKQLKLWNKTCLDHANTLLQYLKCVAS